MGKVTRKRYSGEFKSWVPLEAIPCEQPLAELASKYGVHQTMIAQWKSQDDRRDVDYVLRQACGRADCASGGCGEAARI
ncbi:hypothetical protein GOB81_14190 [Acetobacter sp. LMG 1627]|uniref:Transposase n=1 Tax=Acetobacter conturbans TaxID=1737472 RepID=A0ABX0K3C2_9PROT|nr:hypothetical protein [Acetobacter conturbans]